MKDVNRNRNSDSLAANPIVVWLVIGTGIGIGLGLLLDSMTVAITAGAIAGAVVGWYLDRGKKRNPPAT